MPSPLPTPAALADQFDTIRTRLEPVFLVRTPNGYRLRSDSPYREVTEEALASCDDHQRRAAVAYLFDVALQRPHNKVFRRNSENSGSWILSILGRRKLAWTVDELAWLARFVRTRHHELDEEGLARTLALLTNGVERATADLTPLAADLLWLRDWMVRIVGPDYNPTREIWWWVDPKIEAYAARLHAVIERSRPATLPEHVLDDRDSFGARARAGMLAVVDEPAAAELVTLLNGYGPAPRPAVSWRAQATSALVQRPDLLTAARALLRIAATQTDPVVPDEVWVEHWIHPDSQALIRAALWAVALVDRSEQLTGELRDLGAHFAQSAGAQGLSARSLTVVNAVVAALADRVTDETPGALVATLLTIRRRAANRALTLSIDKAVESIAAASGTDSVELTEQAVPGHGLDGHGCLIRHVGNHVATLRATVTGGRSDVSLSWATAAGRDLSGVPTAVRRDHADELVEMRRTAKTIRQALPPQRDRLDQLMAAGRSWSTIAWHRDYLDHPVVGLFARLLIWRSGSQAGLPERRPDGGWSLRTVEGLLITPNSDDQILLWHPLNEPLEDVLRWRDHLTHVEIRQPFKQAFREIYLLTPAEERTATYSNRFAAHILRYRPAAALMRAREWSTPTLGGWEDGDEGLARRVFGGVRASFSLRTVAQVEWEAEFCATDQVRFESRDADGGWRRIRVEQVEPLIFSETMRDVDLFVGVTSIGADPEWLDNARHGHRNYWEEFSFGVLTASAAMRRDAVQRIIPRTKIADRAGVDGRFLVVHGRLRTYKIHLGSGNVLMSPNDAYLCVVARSAPLTSQIYLPFEEDGRLSVILSKAFLLAEDDAITDLDIVRQIHSPAAAGLRPGAG